MAGIPTVNFVCRVLCRIIRIVRYIPILPPKRDSIHRVFSLIRQLCLIAFILSVTQTVTDITFMMTIYHKI